MVICQSKLQYLPLTFIEIRPLVLDTVSVSDTFTMYLYRNIDRYVHFSWKKFLDAGIQDVSTSISIVHDLIERYQDDNDDGDESDKHI